MRRRDAYRRNAQDFFILRRRPVVVVAATAAVTTAAVVVAVQRLVAYYNTAFYCLLMYVYTIYVRKCIIAHNRQAFCNIFVSHAHTTYPVQRRVEQQSCYKQIRNESAACSEGSIEDIIIYYRNAPVEECARIFIYHDSRLTIVYNIIYASTILQTMMHYYIIIIITMTDVLSI